MGMLKQTAAAAALVGMGSAAKIQKAAGTGNGIIAERCMILLHPGREVTE